MRILSKHEFQQKIRDPLSIILIRYAAIPVLIYLAYMGLVGVISNCYAIGGFRSWLESRDLTTFGYRDAGRLFTWLAILVLAVMFSLLTVCVASIQISRRVPPHVFRVLVRIAAAATLVWAMYLFWEFDTALRNFAYKFTRDFLKPIYESEARGLFIWIKVFTRSVTVIVLPAGAFGALAAASLLLVKTETVKQFGVKLKSAEGGFVTLKTFLSELEKTPSKGPRKRQILKEGEANSNEILADLKDRTEAARNLLLLGSATLTVATLFSYIWFTWPTEFIADADSRKHLSSMAAGYTFFWSVGICLLIALIYVPTMIQLRKLSLLVALCHGSKIHKDQMQWLRDRDITFVDPKGFRELTAMLAPLLAAPLGTIMQKVPTF